MMDQFNKTPGEFSTSTKDQAWVHWLYGEEEGELFYQNQKSRLFLDPFQNMALLLILDVLCAVAGVVVQLVFSTPFVLIFSGFFLVFVGLFFLYSLFANISRVNKLQKIIREVFVGPFGVWQDGKNKDFKWLRFVDFIPGKPVVIELSGYDLDPQTFAGRSSGFNLILPIPLGKEEEGKTLVEAFQALIEGDLKKANSIAQTLTSAPVRKPAPAPGLIQINRKPKKQ
jgi:hypothetical protein